MRNRPTFAAASLEGPPEETALMADYMARFNLAYFSGTFRKEDPAWREDPARALWDRQPDSPYRRYMDMVMDEASGDHLHWSDR